MANGFRLRRAGGANAFLFGGLLVQAGTTYLFLIVTGRALGAGPFGSLSSLYILVTGVATGLFQPLEQEVTRRRGMSWTLHRYEPGLWRTALVQGLSLAGVAAIIALACFPLTRRLLGDDPGQVLVFCAALPGYAMWFLVRGELAGAGRLRRYGIQLALDGTVRLAAGIVLVALQRANPVSLGALFALSPWIAVLLTWSPLGGRRSTRPQAPQAPQTPQAGTFARPYLLLVLSALAAQLLMNAGPVVIGLLATRSERSQVGVFLAALVVIRVPVFLFSAVQPSFLPLLSSKVAASDAAGFTRILWRMTAALTALVLASSLVVVAVGPPVIDALFSFDRGLSRSTYLLLTIAVGTFLIATVQAQALVALGKHANVGLGWLAGLAGLAIGVQWGAGAVQQTTHGLMVGGLVAALGLACLVAPRVRSWCRAAPV